MTSSAFAKTHTLDFTPLVGRSQLHTIIGNPIKSDTENENNTTSHLKFVYM